MLRSSHMNSTFYLWALCQQVVFPQGQEGIHHFLSRIGSNCSEVFRDDPHLWDCESSGEARIFRNIPKEIAFGSESVEREALSLQHRLFQV